MCLLAENYNKMNRLVTRWYVLVDLIPETKQEFSDLGFKQAAVGRVGCASSLPLLPLRLDFCSEKRQLLTV